MKTSRPADPFTRVPPRRAEEVKAHETTPDDIALAAARRADAIHAARTDGKAEQAQAAARGLAEALDGAAKGIEVVTEHAARDLARHPSSFAASNQVEKEETSAPRGDVKSASPATEEASGKDPLPVSSTEIDSLRKALRTADEQRQHAERHAAEQERAAGFMQEQNATLRAENHDLRNKLTVAMNRPELLARAPQEVPAQPPAQHWEVYVGPPRGGRVHDLERVLEGAVGCLEPLIPDVVGSDERKLVSGTIARLKRVLAGGAP